MLDIIKTCSSKKVHTVGDLMRLPRSQAKPLFKKTGLQDGQIEAVKSMLKMIDGEWSDWQAMAIDVVKMEAGRGGTRKSCAEELIDEITTDKDRKNYHLPLWFHAKDLPAHLGGGTVRGPAFKRMDCVPPRAAVARLRPVRSFSGP